MFDDPEELVAFIEKHGGYWDGEVPDATVADWKSAAENDETRLSYWEWAYNETEGET